jgi:hypothetical protein
VARQRATFGKRERERERQARAQAKQEKRLTKSEPTDADGEAEAAPVVDEAAILQALADLHTAYEDGQVSMADFEARREELTQALQVD